jgi:hypothetical protein
MQREAASWAPKGSSFSIGCFGLAVVDVVFFFFVVGFWACFF